MKKIAPIIVRNASELAAALNLTPADAVDMEIRARLNDKIIAAVKESGLTHAHVAKSAGTSRSRLTAILNHDRRNVSTDLLLRILTTLGYRAKLTFEKTRSAA
jgi:predicted XRE-type DNA-binding protein